MSDWPTVMATLAHAWPGEFGDAPRAAYATLLEDEDPGAVLQAVKRLAKRRGSYRPSVSEIFGELRSDPSRPTFDEALLQMRRIVQVRPDLAALERAEEWAHPFVVAFLDSFDVGRFRRLPIDDEDDGKYALRDLREAWERFEDRAEQRDVRGLPVAADGHRRELRRFDPLRALGPGPGRDER